MTTKQLSDYFFGQANTLASMAEKESSEAFDEEDFGSLVASNLDAAYWILAQDVDTHYPLDFYVASNVFSHLLSLRYPVDWAWEESGLGDLVDEEFTKESSTFGYGDYVSVKTQNGIRMGLVIEPNLMYTFDGVLEPMINANKVSKEFAYSFMANNSDLIIKAWIRRHASK